MMRDEPVYRCPNCKSGPRPKGEWATRYGIMTCGTCLHQGIVIMPEQVAGDPEAEAAERLMNEPNPYTFHDFSQETPQ